MEPFTKFFKQTGASASTTHESVSTPEESPIKQCQTPHFKETSWDGTISSNNSKKQGVPYLAQDASTEDKQPSFSLIKSLFSSTVPLKQTKNDSPSLSSIQSSKNVENHECFADESQILYCQQCSEFVCSLCYHQDNQNNNHSSDC